VRESDGDRPARTTDRPTETTMAEVEDVEVADQEYVGEAEHAGERSDRPQPLVRPLDIFTALGIFTGVVKKPSVVKIEGPLEPWALGVLRAQPGFDAEWQPDGQVIIDGRQRPVMIEVKRRVDTAQAHAVASMARRTPRRHDFLLIADEISARAREFLEGNDVAFIDGKGNASIRLPGVFVRTGSAATDTEKQRRSSNPARLAGKAGLVAQALLLDPKRHWKVEDLAASAGVSVGLAHRILARLEDVGLVASTGSGPTKERRLAERGALLDLWAEEDREVHRTDTPGFTLARPGTRPAVIVSERLDRDGVAHAVTGSAAASMVAPVVTSTPVTEIRVTAALPPEAALAAAGCRRAAEGYNVVIIQTPDDLALRFRQRVDGVWMATNPRLYLDLLHDPRRGREQAVEFRQRILGF
jgi:hypothetical protein